MVDTKTLNIKIKASGYKRRALDRRIKQSPFTRKRLAARMGLSEDTLRDKLRGCNQFKLDEVGLLARLLNLSDAELIQIFFKKVHCDFDIYQPGGTKG